MFKYDPVNNVWDENSAVPNIEQVRFAPNGDRFTVDFYGVLCRNDDFEHCIENVNSVQVDSNGVAWVEKYDYSYNLPQD